MKTILITFFIIVVVFCTAMYLLAKNPVLVRGFELLWTICSFGFLLIWAMLHRQGIKQAVANRWERIKTRLCTCRRITLKKVQKDAIVPVEQLKHVRNNVQRLGLALYGMTPERENARRAHFQMLGEEVPPLILPPQNAVLHAEFEGLIRLLNHFGFPHLERVQLRQEDFAFIEQWGSDLEARLRHHQKCALEQQAASRTVLATVARQHKMLGETCAVAQNDAGYQRIQGVLRFLEQMVDDQRCPWDFAHTYAQKLQSDMDTLMKQFEQAIR